MTTLSTKTYLELVNDAVDEAGTDMAQFATDGSDWATQSDAMMNRFKKWVKKAWRELQQEANDWHWLDETAVVTINPGIMFYSDKPITYGTTNINPAAIVDIDGSTYVSGLTVDGMYNLTGLYTKDRPFGYADIRYSDYNQNVTTQGHVLDFGLKAGGFKLTREDGGKISMLLSFENTDSYAAAQFVAEGDAVDTITVTKVGSASTATYAFTNGTVVSKTIVGQVVILQVDYEELSGDVFTTLLSYASSSISDFHITVDLNVITDAGTKTLSGTMRFDDIGNTPITSMAISPLDYKINIESFVAQGANIVTGDTLAYAQYTTTHLGDVKAILTPCSFLLDTIYPDTTDGILNMSVVGETGYSVLVTTGTSTTTDPTCWTLFTTLLFSNAPVCEANFTGAFFYTAEGYVGGVFDFAEAVTLGMYAGGVGLYTYAITYEQPYSYDNYVHSWKSFDWGEELGEDDFVENVRSTNNTTFRIINREDPGVSREVPLTYIPWDEFQNKYDLASVPPSTPRVISEDNTGRYRLYPPPDRPYTIVFDYIREPQELSAFSDVCKGLPAEYEDAVMWRALQMYGEFDEQPAVAARARFNYKNMLMTMQQELRPAFHFAPKRLY